MPDHITLNELMVLALERKLFFMTKTHGDRPNTVTLMLRDKGRQEEARHKLETQGTLSEVLTVATVWLELHGYE